MTALAAEPLMRERVDVRPARERGRRSEKGRSDTGRRPTVARRTSGPTRQGVAAPAVSAPMDLAAFLTDDRVLERACPAPSAAASARVQWRLTDRGMAAVVGLVVLVALAAALVIGAQFAQVTDPGVAGLAAAAR